MHRVANRPNPGNRAVLPLTRLPAPPRSLGFPFAALRCDGPRPGAFQVAPADKLPDPRRLVP